MWLKPLTYFCAMASTSAWLRGSQYQSWDSISALSQAFTTSRFLSMKSLRQTMVPESRSPHGSPVATTRAVPSPAIVLTAAPCGSQVQAPSIWPVRRLVVMTPIERLRYSAGLMPSLPSTYWKKRSEQLPLGVATFLPSSHLSASLELVNSGASLRTSTW